MTIISKRKHLILLRITTKVILTIFLIIIQTILTSAQTPNSWIIQAGGASFDHGYGVTADLIGNIIVTGRFGTTATFGDTGITSLGFNDIFIAKYDSVGNLDWVRQISVISNRSFAEDYDPTSITTDSKGNIIVTGYFRGTATFGDTILTSNGEGFSDIFIAVYDSKGNFVWVEQAGGANNDYSYSVTADSIGNIIVTGRFKETAIFGDIEITSLGFNDIFIAKYDLEGNVVFVKQVGGPGNDYGNSVVLDRNSSIIVTGYFEQEVSFGNNVLTSLGSSDIFIVKYDSEGNLIFVEQGGGIYKDQGTSVTTDSDGNILVVGNIQGGAIFGEIEIASNVFIGMFIAKYDKDGNLLWVERAAGDAEGTGINTDLNRNIIVSGFFGFFQGAVAIFGEIEVASYGSLDIFIAKYDTDGNLLWVEHAGGKRRDKANGLTIEANGNIIVSGSFSKNAIFGKTGIISGGDSDVFILKLPPNGFVETFKLKPLISSIVDIPDDQGGRVFISWEPSVMDFLSLGDATSVFQYGIWETYESDNWISLGSVPAVKTTNEYTYLASTFYDSTVDNGISWSYFKVTAHTLTSTYSSEVDSGYSVDNISPDAPTGLIASLTQPSIIDLSWANPVDEDFSFFRVYRGDSSGFDPSSIEPLIELVESHFTDKGISVGKTYYYRVSAVDANGNESDYSNEVLATVVSIVDGMLIPEEYALHQNYPNPFNPVTTIEYSLPKSGDISLIIYNITGREVIRLLNENQFAGNHRVTWNASNISSGIYFYRLQAGDFVLTRKMVLLN